MSRKRTEAPNDGATRKKTRFVSPEEDPQRFEEEVEGALENPSASRKGRVKTEGYESDSSDEGESVVRSRKPAAAAADEDDDMFAAGDEKKEEVQETGKKKKEQYLRLGDIEGQEFNDERNGSRGETSEESEEEPVDEDEAERRKKAGMGYELTSFNMREEMEEGKFTEDGTYIRTFDPHAVHDKWMEGMSEKDIKRARRAKRAQEKLEEERIKAEERELEQTGGKEGMEQEMLHYMRRGETVLEALARLGEKVKKIKAKQRSEQKARSRARGQESTMDVDTTKQNEKSKASSPPSAPQYQIDRLTTLASKLMDLGDVDIYEKTYEHLVRSVRSAGRVPEDWQPPSGEPKYEYKWAVPGADTADQVFGPFGEEDMKAWYDALYFGPSGEKVKVRVVGGEWGDWDDVVG